MATKAPWRRTTRLSSSPTRPETSFIAAPATIRPWVSRRARRSTRRNSTVPSNAPFGTYRLCVIANGIASDSVTVAVTHKRWKEIKWEIKEVKEIKENFKWEHENLKLVFEDLRKISEIDQVSQLGDLGWGEVIRQLVNRSDQLEGQLRAFIKKDERPDVEVSVQPVSAATPKKTVPHTEKPRKDRKAGGTKKEEVIVILASGLDRDARDLANSWKAYDARILTAEDLHRPGWAFRPDDGAQDGTCVVGGSVVAARDIELALTCRPSVLPEELTGLHPEERQYVAAEMTAFLVAWLTSLTCPMFNRPTATSLCGPAWSVEHLANPGRPLRGTMGQNRRGLALRLRYRRPMFQRPE